MAKYEALGEFLKRQREERVSMSFAEIERIIAAKLPPSARKHRPWWSNNPTNSVITKVWLDAGFESTEVDMAGRRLVFRRVSRRGGDFRGEPGGLAEPAEAYRAEPAGPDTIATTLTSREFDRDAGRARQASSQGPVLITDDGRAAHVLLAIDDYLRLVGRPMSLAEALAQPDGDFDFDPPRIGDGFIKPVDFG